MVGGGGGRRKGREVGNDKIIRKGSPREVLVRENVNGKEGRRKVWKG